MCDGRTLDVDDDVDDEDGASVLFSDDVGEGGCDGSDLAR